MKSIVAWMVLKDDAYYLPMALESVLPYVEGIYIQDQGSTDGSIEIVKEYQTQGYNIIMETEDTGFERFNPTYNEPVYRSMAIERAEQTFKPKYLLQLDADEIYTPHFFDKVDVLGKPLEQGSINALKVATDRFVSKNHRVQSAHALHVVKGEKYYDPHTRFWSTRIKVRYVQNPAMKGFLHCTLNSEPSPVYWVHGICHVHLHRTFGPKSFDFWAEGGDEFERKTPFNAREMAPKWFADDINGGTAEKVDFEWPDYVLKKWEAWGIWE